MKAKTIKGKTVEQVVEGLHQSMADGFRPTLAVVFLSIKQDRQTICKLLDQRGIAVFGVTTAGEFIDGEIGEQSTMIMLLDIKRDYFKLQFEEHDANKEREAARKIADIALQTFSNPAFIVCGSGIKADGEMIIRGIEDIAGNQVTIFGGMAADDFSMTDTFVFTNNRCSNNGIVSVILNEDKIKLKGLTSIGWKPVGIVRTITKSNGCWVHTIDDQPALDMIIKYMGITLKKEKENEATEFLVNVSSNFPMAVQRENGSVVMRTAMLGNWSDNSFMCAGSVPQGANVRFCLPADFEVIDEVIDECREIKEKESFEAEAMLMFSCKARHTAFGPLVSREIEGIKNVWNVPMVGFFTYGEFARATKGNQEFHNISCCWVVMREA